MATLPAPTPERWDRVTRLTAAALERPLAGRSSWLADACAGDEALQREVESLLLAHAGAGRFLETAAIARDGAAEAVVAVARESLGLAAGRQIGPYRIVRELGHGGMGVVYLAARADLAFEKVVAIKVVRGAFPSDIVVQRFRDERRILATLDHPNIARLLDGGATSDGLSYFVMEYVDGIPFDVYCETADLSVIERLRLFAQVCAAVQYAHQRLVIHRDIKARNILVTADGTPKLLDFGIAKLLDPDRADGQQTRTGLRAFTPESASPEQIRGEPVTVSTDVYSLGVLLYRLLTDRGPYRGDLKTESGILRAVCEEEPVRPSDAATDSRRRRDVRGDLDLVALKALRKDAARRYSSVDQLAQDVQRHLHGMPILAAPDAWSYRSRKFVRRHWVGVGATVAVIMALGAGAATTWWQAQRADRRFNDVRQLAHTFIFDIHDEVEKLPGSTTARKLLVTNALSYLDSLATEAECDSSLQRELATSYEKMADVLGRPNTANLGDLPGALAAYRKAQAARGRLLATDAGNAGLRRDLSTTSSKMARVMHLAGDLPGGLEEARKASRIEEALVKSDPTPPAALRLAASYTVEGYLLGASKLTRESVDRFRRAIAILEPLQSSDGLDFRVQLARTYTDFGTLLCLGAPVAGLVPDPKACLEMYQRANAIEEPLAQADPANARLQRSVFAGIVQIGDGFVSLDDRPSAILYFRRACAAGERLAAMDTANLQAQADFALACERLGTSLAQTGGAAEALPLLQRSSRILEPILIADPNNLGTRARAADSRIGLGFAHAALGASPGLATAARVSHWREAKAHFDGGLVFWAEMRDKGIVPGTEGDRPDRLAREIARCDAALARLR